MGRDDSSDSDDYRSDRDRDRKDSRRRRDDRHRDDRRRSRSRSSSPRHRRGRESTTTTTSRRKNDDRSGRYGSYKDVVLRPTVAVHFGQPAIDVADFDNGVMMLTKAEQSGDLEFAREKFDSFLARYPYCYGFWTKYAEYEKKYGSMADSKEVWERGIITIPLSIDLWLGYIAQMKTVPDFPSDRIRELYERALEIAGLEYQSDRLWLDAIGFERSEYIHLMCTGNREANCRKIGNLFDRLLSTPTMHAATHLERYTAYINTIEPNMLLSIEEYQDIFDLARRDIQKDTSELVHQVQQTYIVKSLPPNNQLSIVGERDETTFEVTVNLMEHDPELLNAMRAEIVTRRRKIWENNMKKCEKRALFEANIKRPYFHVKPLDNPQLFNWFAYLDFEISEGDEDRIRILFERSLIACSLYEEFWIKYAKWLWKTSKSKSSVREIYKRAKVHIRNSLNLTLNESAFEENLENYQDALQILSDFRHHFPGYVLLEMRYIGVLRRKAEKEGNGFETVLNQFEKLIAESKKLPNLYSFYSLKFARFHQKVRKDARVAQKILKRAIEADPRNLQLYTQLIDVSYTSEDMNENDVIDAFDSALESQLRLEDKIRFSQRKLDFLEELGTDVWTIEEHRDYHYHLLSQLPDNVTIRTRFVNDPSRISFAPPIPQQMPPMGWQPQMAPPMNMMPPMMPMQAPPPVFMPQQPIQPQVHLTLVEPVVQSDGSGTPME
ncbi:unnamed protein product [Caenorhabditis angaria]|uniref:Suppressor of forked domain-containing protein n=1 Tax=Caenorhabditis angaria TaxID=860376 RepID=A0A9P1ITX3_9PELO|nr:unnamed protein product [Caenorhabditis angaria]